MVLQEKSPKKDDGSLSWAAIRNDIRYINIETRLGMVKPAEKNVELYRKKPALTILIFE